MFGWTFWLFALCGLGCGLAGVGGRWHFDHRLGGMAAAVLILSGPLMWFVLPKQRILLRSMRFRGAANTAIVTQSLAERLRQAEASLQFLAENVQDCAMFTIDPSGCVASWNAGAQRIALYKAEEIIGQHFACFFSEQDQLAGKPQQALEAAANQGFFREEGWRVRGDGSRFLADVTINPLRAESGKLNGFAKITRDITQCTQTEHDLEQARAALAQSQKMAAVGQLTGGIAHDFNNMLAAILGSLELLKIRQERFNQGSESALDVIRHAVDHGAELTRRLMAFSRKQAPEPALTDTNQLVSGMAELLQRTLGSSITVETVLASGLWPACVDANQVESALLNLAVNARDAMRGEGRIVIETGNALLDEDYTFVNRDVTPGQYSFIAVSDTGTGMTPEVLQRAFEPFYTTKDTDHGTGLGLSQVQGFVRQTGGHVHVRSEMGHGTTVKMYFPRPDAERNADAIETGDQHGPLPRGDETILVVGDNDDIRTCSSIAARQLGYSVLEAADAGSAIVLLDENPSVRLLFTDVGPTGTNGPDLADRAKTVRPDLKVVFTSGLRRTTAGGRGTLGLDESLLEQPSQIESFAKILRSALDAA